MLSQANVGAIVFFVSDLARSLRFYADTLGLPVQAADGPDGAYAVGQLGDLHLVFIVRPATTGESPVIVFNIAGGIDDYAEDLTRHGVEIVVPVSDCPDGGLSVDFVDPDGNLLSLYQPPGMPRQR
jgi:predicted enzyme related to lactoylglutathione lyase